MAQVKITFKEDRNGNPLRPDAYTEDSNIENVERLHGAIIQEIVYLDRVQPIKRAEAKEEVRQTMQMSDSVLYKELLRRGLTQKAIKSFMKWDEEKQELLSK
jgi:hypothetical protein